MFFDVRTCLGTHFLSRCPVVDLWSVLCSLKTVFASPWPLVLRINRDYAAFLNSSNRLASRSRSGRSTPRRGSWIICPTIPFSPSSRNGPSWISSSRSETWMRKSGSIPISWASKAAWWSFVNGRPFETTGCPHSSSASMIM